MEMRHSLLILLLGLLVRNGSGSSQDDHVTRMLSGYSAVSPQGSQLSSMENRNNSVRKCSDETQAAAVEELLKRLLPSQAHLFQIAVDSSIAVNGTDTVQVESPLRDGTEGVSVKGSSGVAAAWGVLHYLKQYCNCHISWEADQLNLPVILPHANFSTTAKDKVRYYQNVCTVSYSSVWWQWPRWEREIDWMALNGINLPLAFTGQEAVWRRVYLKLGLTDEDLQGYFSGPAFLAWQRMGNLMAWGGPLPLSWIDAQELLQKKILARMRELGITPVLPCFAGHIPAAIQRVYPDVNVTRLDSWGGFNDTYTRTYLLEPGSSLYTQIGSMFIEEMKEAYNYTDGFYNCDPYNEQTPSSSSEEFISSVSTSIFGAMEAADPDAIWVLQGWFLLNDGFWTVDVARPLFTSVEQGRILVLDLAGANKPMYDLFESFYGQPFVFCMLHNYGGVDGLNGFTDNIIKNLEAARSGNNTMVGTGTTMEGINQNYVMYDLMMEAAWTGLPHDVISWAEQYSIRRYGSSAATKAWDYLMPNIYNNTDPSKVYYHGRHALFLRPSLHSELNIWYPVADLVASWDSMIAAANSSLAEAIELKKRIRKSKKTPQTLLASSYMNKRRIGMKLQLETHQKNYSEEEFLALNKDLRDADKPSKHFIWDSITSEETKSHSRTVGGKKQKYMEDENTQTEMLKQYRNSLNNLNNKFSINIEDLENNMLLVNNNWRNNEKYKFLSLPQKSIIEQQTFQHDLVDVTREVLQDLGAAVIELMVQEYRNGSYDAVQESGELLTDLLLDLDDLLATCPAFLLGVWTKAAASWATNDQEKELYVYNALNQISLWGPDTVGPYDYAIKQWSGQVTQYYLPRWQLFIQALLDSITGSAPYDQEQLNEKLLESVEKPFTFDTDRDYPDQPVGDSIQTALKLYRKYRHSVGQGGIFDQLKASKAADTERTSNAKENTKQNYNAHHGLSYLS